MNEKKQVEEIKKILADLDKEKAPWDCNLSLYRLEDQVEIARKVVTIFDDCIIKIKKTFYPKPVIRCPYCHKKEKNKKEENNGFI